MIKIKAFKDNPQQAPAHEAYFESAKDKDDDRRKLPVAPVAFLLFLSGLVLYLKGFMQGRSEASGQESAPSAEAGNDGMQMAAEEPQPPLLTEPLTGMSAEPGDKVTPGNVVPFSSPASAPLPALGEFMAPDSPAIDFSTPWRPSFPRIEASPGFVQPINDNQSPGGGGGGTGGGSGSSASGPASPDKDGPDGEDEPPSPDQPDQPAGNRAPRVNGPLRLQDLIGCQAYFIPLAALLHGTSDPDGDPLLLLDLKASSGTLTPVTGGWAFEPAPGWLGEVTLTYSVSDGTAAVPQFAAFRVMAAPPIVGTEGPDALLGTECGEQIAGGAGDDNIDARGGSDAIDGGSGDDYIVAGAGDDVVFGGDGNDIVFGGDGNDIISGGDGNDRLFGENGDDILLGDAGDDLLSGGDGDDSLLGGDGGDELHGDAGADLLDGGSGDDALFGGDGDDVIFAGSGADHVDGGDGDDFLSDGEDADVVHGGSGNDHVAAAADAANDRYCGGEGEDTLDYSTARLDIVVDIRSGRSSGLDIGLDLISGFETIVAGSGNDHLIAGPASITMTGGGGRNTFEFKTSDHVNRPDLVWKITDFTIGDRLIVASYEIQYGGDDDIQNEIRDLFKDIYLSSNEDRRPVRFRFEKNDDRETTFIDVQDGDHPETVYSIELSGRHQLDFTVFVS